MSLIAVVLVLIVVGVLLWLVNTQMGAVIDAKILKVINIVVVVAVVLWLLSVFGLIDWLTAVKVPRVGG